MRMQRNRDKKIAFRIELTLVDCSNITENGGKVFCKFKFPWKKTATIFKHSGCSSAKQVVNHCTAWNHKISLENCEMMVSTATNMVCDYILRLSIRQVNTNKYGGFERIGTATINIAEYLKEPHTTRRYLLENCKTNCTIKVIIRTEQIMGDPVFQCPHGDHMVGEKGMNISYSMQKVLKKFMVKIDVSATSESINWKDMAKSRLMQPLPSTSSATAVQVVEGLLKESAGNYAKQLPSR